MQTKFALCLKLHIFVIGHVVVHATTLHCSLFIEHWIFFIVHSSHSIVHPDVQYVMHSTYCTIVHSFEQFVDIVTKFFNSNGKQT